MNPLNPSAQFQLRAFGTQGLKQLTDGATVRIEILGKGVGGLQLVRIAGKVLSAYPVAGLESGTTLLAKVKIQNGLIFLHPLPPNETTVPPAVSAAPLPALSEESVLRLLATFFSQIGMQPETATLKRLRALTARFPGREGSAALAAVILEERGLTADYSTVRKLTAVLDGDDDEDGEDSDYNDLLALVNHRAGSTRHWVVFPFKRTFSAVTFCGSLRLLLDTAASTVVTTELKAGTAALTWFFRINSGILEFDASADFEQDELHNFIVYLKSLPGIEKLKRVRRVKGLLSGRLSVDVEA